MPSVAPPPADVSNRVVPQWMQPIVDAPLPGSRSNPPSMVEADKAHTELLGTIDQHIARLIEIRSRLMAANLIAKTAKLPDPAMIEEYTQALREMGDVVGQTADAIEQILFASEMVVTGAQSLR